MSTILASRAPSFFLRRRKYYKIIIIPQKTWPPELTTSVTFLRVSTKSWLAFSDIRKENISKIMIKTPKNIPKDTVSICSPQITTWCVSFFACYICRVPPAKFGAIGEISQDFFSAIFNAYFPSIYPTVLHAPAK